MRGSERVERRPVRTRPIGDGEQRERGQLVAGDHRGGDQQDDEVDADARRDRRRGTGARLRRRRAGAEEASDRTAQRPGEARQEPQDARDPALRTRLLAAQHEHAARERGEHQEEAEALRRPVVLADPVRDGEEPGREPDEPAIARRGAEDDHERCEVGEAEHERRPLGDDERARGADRARQGRAQREEARPVEVRVDVRVDHAGARDRVGDADVAVGDVEARLALGERRDGARARRR